MNQWQDLFLSPTKDSDRIQNITKYYENQTRIKNMKVKLNSVLSFSFQLVSVYDVSKFVIWDLKNNKSVSGEIPVEILTNCINKSIEIACFSDSRKKANINSVFKIYDLLDKSNYRPGSILPLVSKV